MPSKIPARVAPSCLATLVAVLLGACGGQGRAAKSEFLTPTTLPPSEPAVIALPVTIVTSAVQTHLERTLPRADSLDQARCQSLGGAVCHQYVFRRDTLALHVAGDRIDVLARLRYRGRVSLPTGGSVGSCGYPPEPMPRAELRFTTSLYWTTAWRLASRNTSLTSSLPDPCRVTLLGIDATPIMRRIADAQLARVAQEVDSALPTLADLRRPADSLWRAMQEPMPLDSTGSLWLLMNPERVGLAALDGQGTTIRTGLTLVARPRVVTGARPDITVRPLPSLALAPLARGLRVPVQVEMPFAAVSRRATELLAAETAREPLKVTRVDVAGAGDSAVVRLALAGRMNASLTLAGRPRFDVGTRTLVVDDLHYSVESRDFLSRVKATLGAPLIRHAIEQATNGGRLALGPQLDSARAQLTAQMNRPLAPDVVVGGGVTSLRLTGLYLTNDAFVVRVLLEGEAGLWAK
ncbi:Protein of unknown function DUF4403 [Gemmatirosa kalamazoonensis]|uniref:DUF4403 family protein n=1 Tax=Gemmatirosa kalamazoonensis TaxID=861299 RepID=W0RJP7_9BACT|nr:DUF4403 family protein [Gemmatirosa kalamazoonensis]AHG90565.1 Protein of unknown function DUF4403 [Gemmatirosa kalamazoonensis]